MKKYILSATLLISACQTQMPAQYVSNMYAKGTLTGYENTGASCEINTNCPGCHVKQFNRATLTVTEIASSNQLGVAYFLDGCEVNVTDSLNIQNISTSKYIPAIGPDSCKIIFEQEIQYLKAMGFSE